ncbi:MAG: hypothetical protein AB7E36_02800 [Salinivirgaceae bacterium]
MKKTKKNIKQFQQALLTNTGFIKQSDESEPVPEVLHESLIEDEVLQKFTLLAEFEGTTTKELINKALNHFLRLKSLQLEEAMKKLK